MTDFRPYAAEDLDALYMTFMQGIYPWIALVRLLEQAHRANTLAQAARVYCSASDVQTAYMYDDLRDPLAAYLGEEGA